jgi:hypothetical protein
VKSTAVSLNSTVSDLKTSNEVLKTTVAKEQADAKKAEETGPTTIKYKGVNITPGGFLVAETVFRQRAASADIPTPMNAIPYPGNALSRVTESNFSGRQSRITMLVDTKLSSAKLTGYYEADFLGAGTTSNNRQTNSYVLRQRQAWAQAAFDSGLSFTGGQMWSLATETRKGIQNRTETMPMTIDVNYTVGFTYLRGYGFRVVKDFGGKFAVAASVEGPQSTFGGRGFSTVTSATGATTQNFFINAPGAGGGLYNAFDATGYTVNKAPDMVFKVAADPGYGHYELFGILSTFRNRIYPCAIVSPAASNASGTVILNGPVLAGNSGTCVNTAPSAIGAYNDTFVCQEVGLWRERPGGRWRGPLRCGPTCRFDLPSGRHAGIDSYRSRARHCRIPSEPEVGCLSQLRRGIRLARWVRRLHDRCHHDLASGLRWDRGLPRFWSPDDYHAHHCQQQNGRLWLAVCQ